MLAIKLQKPAGYLRVKGMLDVGCVELLNLHY